jgi:acetyl-CoA synthetase
MSRAGSRIADQDAFVASALRDPEGFWRERASRIVWETVTPQTIFRGSLAEPHWFEDGRLNATVSCLDRHAASHPDATAYDYLCENGSARTPDLRRPAGPRQPARQRAARRRRAPPATASCIYMPLTIEGIVAMLACARIGAIHSVVYAGLGATALRDRIVDAGARCDRQRRHLPARESVDLKSIVDDAVAGLEAGAHRRAQPRRYAGRPTARGRFEAYTADAR